MKKSKQGFTIIELIIVISIISLMTLVATPNYLKYKNDADNEEALNIARGIYLSSMDYKIINNKPNAEKMREFIQSDLGMEILSLEERLLAGEKIFEVIYCSNKKIYKCSFNMDKNQYKVFKMKNSTKEDNIIYKNY